MFFVTVQLACWEQALSELCTNIAMAFWPQKERRIFSERCLATRTASGRREESHSVHGHSAHSGDTQWHPRKHQCPCTQPPAALWLSRARGYLLLWHSRHFTKQTYHWGLWRSKLATLRDSPTNLKGHAGDAAGLDLQVFSVGQPGHYCLEVTPGDQQWQENTENSCRVPLPLLGCIPSPASTQAAQVARASSPLTRSQTRDRLSIIRPESRHK